MLRAGNETYSLNTTRNLIGKSATKCNVVLKREGVLDVHALLTLSPSLSSAFVIPMPSKKDGKVAMIFLNDQLMTGKQQEKEKTKHDNAEEDEEEDGFTIKHGDKIAFGRKENTFTFDLLPLKKEQQLMEQSASPMKENMNTMSTFRVQMDALRGDRLQSTRPLGASGYMSGDRRQKPLDTLNNISASMNMGASSSWDSNKFLMDASMDSMLSEYVERKLRLSSTTASMKPSRSILPRREVMEPPPSMSFNSSMGFNDSTVGKSRKDFDDDEEEPQIPKRKVRLSLSSAADLNESQEKEDSMSFIQDDSLNLSASFDPQNKTWDNLKKSYSKNQQKQQEQEQQVQPLSPQSLSQPQRDRAERERLRISQKLRDINNVLNGFTDYNESYLSHKSKRKSKSSLDLDSEEDKEVKEEEEDKEVEEEEEEEEEEELPTMMEKTNTTSKMDTPSNSATQSTSSAAEILPKEPIRQSTSDEGASSPTLASRSSSAPSPSRRSSSVGGNLERRGSGVKRRPRTELHQQLIDRTIRQKRREILSKALIEWQRGLRIQRTHRQHKCQQTIQAHGFQNFQKLKHSFTQWQKRTRLHTQILEQRLEAFLQRHHFQLYLKTWYQWKHFHLIDQKRHFMLYQIIQFMTRKKFHVFFQRWQSFTIKQRHFEKQQQKDQVQKRGKIAEVAAAQNKAKAKAEAEAEAEIESAKAAQATAAMHANHQKSKQIKHQLACKHHQHKVLQKKINIFQRWKKLTSHQVEAKKKITRLWLRQCSYKKRHAWMKWKIHTLHDRFHYQLVQEKTKATQAQAKVEQEVANKKPMVNLISWNEQVESFLEEKISFYDEKIVHVSQMIDQLMLFEQEQEDLHEKADKKIHLQAAMFLVQENMNQKVNQSTQRLQLQENLYHFFYSHPNSISNSNPDKDSGVVLSNQGEFLYEMLEQRFRRLHQLFLEIAKLAATTETTSLVDPYDKKKKNQKNSYRGMVDIKNNKKSKSKNKKLRDATYLADTMYQRDLVHVNEMLKLYKKFYS